MKNRPHVFVALIGLLLGVGNPMAAVVCFGADGHIEVVPLSSEDHCCDCPTHAGSEDVGHRCSSCVDVPLPQATGEAILIPGVERCEALKALADYTKCALSVTPISPDSFAPFPGADPYAHGRAIAAHSTVVLLI